MNNELEMRIWDAYVALHGRQTVEFRRGWFTGLKEVRKADLEEFLDELHNDIEQTAYMKEKGALNE